MIRLEQTADGWVVEVTGDWPDLKRFDGGRFELQLGQHEVVVVEPEPDTEEALRDGIARLKDKRNEAAGMVRAVLVEKAVADAVAKEKAFWVEHLNRVEVDSIKEERARCLWWVVSGRAWSEIIAAVRDGTEAPDVVSGK